VVSVPVVAAVNASAHGLGAELVLWSDLAVMSRSAVLSLPEVSRGLIAAGGGAIRLPRLVPPKVAMRWLLTAESIPAAEALRWGLINEVCSADDVLRRALALAEQVAAQAPLAVRATKRLTTGTTVDLVRPVEAADFERVDQEVALNEGTHDALGGVRSFVDRRPPQWLGR
jgi:crotonobetainyl-CoA hydratase